MSGNEQRAWLRLVEVALDGIAPEIELVSDAAAGFEVGIPGGLKSHDDATRSSNVEDAATRSVDCRFVEGLIEPGDSAVPWNRAATLLTLHRYAEAGRDYLDAAARFQREADEGNGLTGDESDWVEDALFHACEAFISAGYFLTAAVISQRLPQDLRRSVVDVIRDSIS